jgi:hypothetical protein
MFAPKRKKWTKTMFDEPICNRALEAFLQEESQRGRAFGVLADQLKDIHRLEEKLAAVMWQISRAESTLAACRAATEDARAKRASILARAEADAASIRKTAADKLAEADIKSRQANQRISDAEVAASRIIAKAMAAAKRISCYDR